MLMWITQKKMKSEKKTLNNIAVMWQNLTTTRIMFLETLPLQPFIIVQQKNNSTFSQLCLKLVNHMNNNCLFAFADQ